jgi:hypothetical protein
MSYNMKEGQQMDTGEIKMCTKFWLPSLKKTYLADAGTMDKQY